MTPDLMFTVATLGVVPFWLLLIVAPFWRGTELLTHSILPALVLGATYTWLFASGAFTNVPDTANFTSLSGLMVMFTLPEAVVAGWIHYLVFDLFVGAWEVRDARRRGINHLLVIPCVVLTFLLGPIGLLLYVVLRLAIGKGGWTLDLEAKA
jgi:hypothetical protein